MTNTERISRRASGAPATADPAAAVASTAGSTGTALPEGVRAQFESSLSTDLSSVRVHTGSASATAAEGLGARAFAVGQDIHFGAGQYQPDDPFGVHLLAHEVAHTVQQSDGGPRMKLEVSEPGDSFEVEADRAADAMVSGSAATIGGGHGAQVSRQTAGEAAHEAAHQRDATNGAEGTAASPAAAPRDNAAARAYATKLATEAGARVRKGDKDQIRDAKFQANDEHKGEEAGDAALAGWTFLRDPFDNTVTAVRPDGSGVQFTYQVDPGAAGVEGGAAEPPTIALLRELELSELRVKALQRQDKMAPIELQEGAGGPAKRMATDAANGKAARAEYRALHPGVVEAWEEKMKEWTEGGKQGPAPKPPLGYRVNDLKTTMCTATPTDVYHAAGGDAQHYFPFTPPKDWKSWRTLDTHPAGPSPGDVYYLWDIAKNQGAHMGVFKSASPVPGNSELWTWVVTDGGQGGYEQIQQAQERTRGPFNIKNGIFSSSIAEAGQSKGARKLTGWVDIDAFRAEPELPKGVKK